MSFKKTELPIGQLQKIGLSIDALKRSGDYEKLLAGQRTGLVPVKIGEERGEAILYLERQSPRGVQLKVVVSTYRQATREEIDVLGPPPFDQIQEYGITRETLRETGDLERVLNGETSQPIEVELIIVGKKIKRMAELQLIIKEGRLRFYFTVLE